MKNWISEVEQLLGKWDKVAGNKALLNLQKKGDKSTDELLMGYAVAKELYGLVFVRYANQRQTLSQEDAELLDLAVKIADLAIPKGHPLRGHYFKEVGFITDKYQGKYA